MPAVQKVAGASAHSGSFSLPETNIAAFLQSPEADPCSGLPLGACSLLLRYHLPELEVERYVRVKQEKLEQGQAQVNAIYKMAPSLVTGSSTEGLSVPPYREREVPPAPGVELGHARGPFFESSDIDVMSEVKHLGVELDRVKGRFFIDEKRASHVGYARVVLDGPEDTYGLSSPVLSMCGTEKEDGKSVSLLSNTAVKRFLAKVAEANSGAHDFLVSDTGPAVNLQPNYSGQKGLDLIPDTDMVPALPLTGHPPAFSEWLRRVGGRNVSWPSPQVREDIRRHARCFLVGTGHMSSTNRALEWRLSFSDPEKRLAQSLTPIQRKVYLLIKMIQKCYLKEPKVVVTYHLKTLMFYELEASRPEDWNEQKVFQRVLSFLERIEACLEAGFLPSYFYPTNNLISHADPGNVAAALALIKRIRNNPLDHLYGIDDRFWFGFSTTAPLSSLHRPVLDVIRGGSTGEILRRLAASLLRQARVGTDRNLLWLPRCADLLRDVKACLTAETGGNEGTSGTATADRIGKPRGAGETSGKVGPGGARKTQDAGKTNHLKGTKEIKKVNAKSKSGDAWTLDDWLTLATIAVFDALRWDELGWLLHNTGGFGVPDESGSSVQAAPSQGKAREDVSCEEDPLKEVLRRLMPEKPEALEMLEDFLGRPETARGPIEPSITMKYFKMRASEVKSMPAQDRPSRVTLHVPERSLRNEDFFKSGRCRTSRENPAITTCKESNPQTKPCHQKDAVVERPQTRHKNTKCTDGTAPDFTRETKATVKCASTTWEISATSPKHVGPAAAPTGVRPRTKTSRSAATAASDKTTEKSTSGSQQDDTMPKMMKDAILPKVKAQAVVSRLDEGEQHRLTDRLSVAMLFRDVYGTDPDLLSRLHRPALDAIGRLRRSRRPHLACRCALWLHQLTALYGGWGMESEPTFDLASASHFVDSLPESVASVLRRSGATKAAMLPLTAFVVSVVMLDDQRFRREVMKMEVGWAQFQAFDLVPQMAGAGVSEHDDAVIWTNAVMKLCLLEMMGKDVEGCLRKVGDLSGPKMGLRAREILQTHQL